jgi:hypothetical protein
MNVMIWSRLGKPGAGWGLGIVASLAAVCAAVTCGGMDLLGLSVVSDGEYPAISKEKNMRLLAIAAAALMVTGVAAVPASAQNHGGPGHGGPGHGRPGPNHGRPGGWHGGHGHARCNWVWRHHHRVRRCF